MTDETMDPEEQRWLDQFCTQALKDDNLSSALLVIAELNEAITQGRPVGRHYQPAVSHMLAAAAMVKIQDIGVAAQVEEAARASRSRAQVLVAWLKDHIGPVGLAGQRIEIPAGALGLRLTSGNCGGALVSADCFLGDVERALARVGLRIVSPLPDPARGMLVIVSA